MVVDSVAAVISPILGGQQSEGTIFCFFLCACFMHRLSQPTNSGQGHVPLNREKKWLHHIQGHCLQIFSIAAVSFLSQRSPWHGNMGILGICSRLAHDGCFTIFRSLLHDASCQGAEKISFGHRRGCACKHHSMFHSQLVILFSSAFEHFPISAYISSEHAIFVRSSDHQQRGI